MSGSINRQGRNPFSEEEKGQKPSNTKRNKSTREEITRSTTNERAQVDGCAPLPARGLRNPCEKMTDSIPAVLRIITASPSLLAKYL